MRKILLALLSTALIITSCKKYDFDKDGSGEGLDAFSLLTPASGAKLALNSATPNEKVTITWSAARPGLNTAPTYTWIAALRTGSIEQPILSIPSDNEGKDTKLTLTYKQIDDALKSKGVADAATADLQWTVIANNGDVEVRANEVNFIDITRFGDGVSPFAIYGPVSSNSTIEINPFSTTDSVKFVWQTSNSSSTSKPVTYTIEFIKPDGSFSAPVLASASNKNGIDTVRTWSYADFNEALIGAGFTDLGSPVALKWRVVAKSGTYSLPSLYVNDVVYLRELKFYLVGGSSPAGWEPARSVRFIQDTRDANYFYAYSYLSVDGFGFKILNQQEWPGGPLNAKDWGMKKGSPGDLAEQDEDNLSVPSSGYYRVMINMKDLKYWIEPAYGQMATVGSATPASWNPGAAFPSQALGTSVINRFVGIVDFVGGGEFKLIDFNNWPDGSLRGPHDFGLKSGTTNVLVEQGENNIPGPATAGKYRLAVNATDPKNITYTLEPFVQVMKIVGDGLADFPQWNPGGSPNMTYLGDGRWTLSIKLKAGKDFKFLAGNDWGAFDYEDNGGGTIKWEGGNNFKVPGNAGDADKIYTVTLDEYRGTVTLQ
ncbi:SusE domain-containing protein [Flavihumibacter rivuli]|uniref:SusE domain-containing protein n=1 Tax=Flavihumibacter rivuli TaxID=2838156 RepID=UPI001BDE3B27|nr:SusE domain-containing protein [Flavihumibacter rivuli]ULQ55285.1 SusE domain-containing protein [Flavihumibacter rivuli]